MNTKSIALVITFSAVAIALNTIKIPTLYWPGNFYQVCEIPIVIALLLFSFKIGVFVAAINLAGQLAFFLYSPVYIVAYPVALIAVLLMLSGVYLANIFISRRPASGRPAGWKRSTLYLTAFAVLFRGGIMPLIDAAVFYRLLLPLLGYPILDTYIIGLLPVFILFNATTPLYTVPLAYFSATKASALLRLKPQVFPDSQTQ